MIKSIQSLGEVRIADIIKVLTKGADYLPTGSAELESPAPASKAEAKEEAPAPELKPEPEPEPAPKAQAEPVAEFKAEAEPEPEAAPKKTAKTHGVSALDSLASMIDEAPEVTEAPPPPPKPEPKADAKPQPEPEPKEDNFYQDPLIQSALEKFQGKIVTS